MVAAAMNGGPPLDVLVVGCGNIAGRFDMARGADEPPLTHAGAFSRDPAFRLVACVEPDAARRLEFMRRWNVPQGFASLQDADGLRVDIASICSPTASHAADLDAVLGLGPRAIFCEKPVTPTAAETEALAARCRERGVLLAVNHTRRWAPDVRRLRDELAQGRWGALRSIAGVYNKGILNNGAHLVDLVHFLAGPLRVLSAGRPVPDFRDDDPTIAALLETHAGVPVTLATAHAADYALFELQLVTERGVLTMENGGMQWRLRTSEPSPHFAGYRALGAPVASEGDYPLAMGAAARNLHGAVTRGEALASDGASALEAQRVCEAIRRAAHLAFPSP